MPDSSDRLFDLGIAMAAVAGFVWLMHWYGRGRGGIMAGLTLAAASWIYLQSLEAGAYALWVAVRMNGAADWGFVAFLATLAIALFVPSSMAISRLDPDY